MKIKFYRVPNSSLLSLSSPELEKMPYTGTCGLYSAVTPTNAAINIIMRIVDRLGLAIDGSLLHCTVMYSKHKCPGLETPVACDPNKTYRANLVKVQHWDGHDKKGYLSLSLQSDELAAEHKRLKSLGCEAHFDYNPHITLWSGIPLSVELEQRMHKAMPDELRNAEIELTSQFIGDLKDD